MKYREAMGEWRAAKDRLAINEDALKMHEARVEALRKSSNLSERFATRTFDTFDTSVNADAYQACRKYVDDAVYSHEKNSLLICGPCGTGKTHLAAAIANTLLDSGVAVLFDTYTGHLNKLKAEFDSKSDRGYLSLLKICEVLILDDVGKEKQSEWAESVMFDTINARYEGLRPVIITSNFGNKELKSYFGDACYSRLTEMCSVVVTAGPDKRKRSR